jgi:hypothetical protein
MGHARNARRFVAIPSTQINLWLAGRNHNFRDCVGVASQITGPLSFPRAGHPTRSSTLVSKHVGGVRVRDVSGLYARSKFHSGPFEFELLGTDVRAEFDNLCKSGARDYSAVVCGYGTGHHADDFLRDRAQSGIGA